MENIRQVVCENLISLRKSHKYTQLELSKKINYSDKAISRWEKGEVLPDYEVLNTIAGVYGVDIAYFFQKHETFDDINEEIKKEEEKKVRNNIFMYILSCFVIFTLATIIFVSLLTLKNINMWTIFVLAIPVSCGVLLYFNYKFSKNTIMRFILVTIIAWTTLIFVYLQLIKYNIWPLFLVGAPLQGVIVFYTLMTGGFKKKKSEETKVKNKRKKSKKEKIDENTGEKKE